MSSSEEISISPTEGDGRAAEVPEGRRVACVKCKARPQFPVPHTALHEKQYYCITCRYPPCDTPGCDTPRPQHTKANIFNLPSWLCEECCETAVFQCLNYTLRVPRTQLVDSKPSPDSDLLSGLAIVIFHQDPDCMIFPIVRLPR